MIPECQLQCLASQFVTDKKIIHVEAHLEASDPVEAKDVDGKKGEKEKKKFFYTKDLSATGPLLGRILVIWAFCPCAGGSARFSKLDHKVNYKIAIESYPE